MFEKRKPIYAGVTYIFDALNESNMAASTSVVTTIKKAKKKHYWIVLSVNNGDIFECHENLLTEFVKYDDVNDIIRCQYGTTDFDIGDVAFFDIITEGLDMMSESIEDEKFKELNKEVKAYADKLRDKIKKYAEISHYKHMITTIGNIKNNIDKFYEKEKSKTSQERESLIEALVKAAGESIIEKKENAEEEFKDMMQESGFYEKFDNEVKHYMFSKEDRDTFIDNALDLLEEEFPSEAMIPPEKQYRCITKEDIEALKKAVAKALHSNNMVFLVGMTSRGEQIAVCVFDISDFDEIDKFVSTCYDKWEDRNVNYYTDHRIVLLSVPNRPNFFDFENDEEDDCDE
jgi:hypothetical protein